MSGNKASSFLKLVNKKENELITKKDSDTHTPQEAVSATVKKEAEHVQTPSDETINSHVEASSASPAPVVVPIETKPTETEKQEEKEVIPPVRVANKEVKPHKASKVGVESYKAVFEPSWPKSEKPVMVTMNLPSELVRFFNTLATAEKANSYMIVVNILNEWKANNLDYCKESIKKLTDI